MSQFTRRPVIILPFNRLLCDNQPVEAERLCVKAAMSDMGQNRKSELKTAGHIRDFGTGIIVKSRTHSRWNFRRGAGQKPGEVKTAGCTLMQDELK